MDRDPLYCDVDETLLMHDLSKYPGTARITIENGGRVFVGVPNHKMIGMVKKFFNLGYDVYVWSKTGSSYARAVTQALGLQPYVKDCLKKPVFYADDHDVTYWMGKRVYREP